MQKLMTPACPKWSGFIIHAHFIRTCIGGSAHSEQVGLAAHVMQSYLSGISGRLTPRYMVDYCLKNKVWQKS